MVVEKGRTGGWSNGLSRDWVLGKICSVPNSVAHLPRQLGQVTNPFNLFLKMGIILHGQADDEISVLFSSSFYQGRALPFLLKPIPWVLKGITWCAGWTLNSLPAPCFWRLVGAVFPSGFLTYTVPMWMLPSLNFGVPQSSKPSGSTELNCVQYVSVS